MTNNVHKLNLEKYIHWYMVHLCQPIEDEKNKLTTWLVKMGMVLILVPSFAVLTMAMYCRLVLFLAMVRWRMRSPPWKATTGRNSPGVSPLKSKCPLISCNWRVQSINLLIDLLIWIYLQVLLWDDNGTVGYKNWVTASNF